MPRRASPGLRFGRSARSVSVGMKPASVLPAPVGAISSTDFPACALASSSIWWARGDQPRSANHFMNWFGQDRGRRSQVGLEVELARHASDVARRRSAPPSEIWNKRGSHMLAPSPNQFFRGARATAGAHRLLQSKRTAQRLRERCPSSRRRSRPCCDPVDGYRDRREDSRRDARARSKQAAGMSVGDRPPDQRSAFQLS